MSTSAEQVRVLCIGGSTRPNSSSEKAIRVAQAAAEAAGATTELILSRDLMLPIYDTETPHRTEGALHFLEAVRAADALLIASPGYHGAMSGMIKNALDYLEDTNHDARVYLDGVPVGCIAVAYGWQATVSTLHSIRTVVHALRGWPSPLGGTVNASGPVFGADGTCTDDGARFQLQTIAAQVVEFAALRRAAAPAAVS
jgi:FMN reductase